VDAASVRWFVGIIAALSCEVAPAQDKDSASAPDDLPAPPLDFDPAPLAARCDRIVGGRVANQTPLADGRSCPTSLAEATIDGVWPRPREPVPLEWSPDAPPLLRWTPAGATSNPSAQSGSRVVCVLDSAGKLVAALGPDDADGLALISGYRVASPRFTPRELGWAWIALCALAPKSDPLQFDLLQSRGERRAFEELESRFTYLPPSRLCQAETATIRIAYARPFAGASRSALARALTLRGENVDVGPLMPALLGRCTPVFDRFCLVVRLREPTTRAAVLNALSSRIPNDTDRMNVVEALTNEPVGDDPELAKALEAAVLDDMRGAPIAFLGAGGSWERLVEMRPQLAGVAANEFSVYWSAHDEGAPASAARAVASRLRTAKGSWTGHGREIRVAVEAVLAGGRVADLLDALRAVPLDGHPGAAGAAVLAMRARLGDTEAARALAGWDWTSSPDACGIRWDMPSVPALLDTASGADAVRAMVRWLVGGAETADDIKRRQVFFDWLASRGASARQVALEALDAVAPAPPDAVDPWLDVRWMLGRGPSPDAFRRWRSSPPGLFLVECEPIPGAAGPDPDGLRAELVRAGAWRPLFRISGQVPTDLVVRAQAVLRDARGFAGPEADALSLFLTARPPGTFEFLRSLVDHPTVSKAALFWQVLGSATPKDQRAAVCRLALDRVRAGEKDAACAIIAMLVTGRK
jgi:hypothetical protein